jgi:D-glycero-D-manno-heptose 1,7-bisphosphate phosphatase
MPAFPLTSVVFLDRDGVINRDSPDYVTSWEAFEFLSGSLEAMARLTRAGFSLIVVTNQSAVGRGLMTAATLEEMHRRLREVVAAHGGRIHDILHCPHLPSAGCACRKPAPGMLLEAQRRHGIQMAAATMIGDSAKDIEAARQAGCGRVVLVGSGLTDAGPQLEARGLTPDHVADDLRAAADWLLRPPAPQAPAPGTDPSG